MASKQGKFKETINTQLGKKKTMEGGYDRGL